MKKIIKVQRKTVWGLTGGMGSGKSTVLGMFRKKGARTLDADQIVHDALDHDDVIRNKIVGIFGKEVLKNDKKLDKKRLAALVFSSPVMRKKLETLLHPVVRRVMQRAIQRTSTGVIVCDIPLLYETKLEDQFAGVVVVNASQKVRVARLVKKKYQLKDLKARMNAQMPLASKVKKADFVVNNNEAMKQTQKAVNFIWDAMLAANS